MYLGLAPAILHLFSLISLLVLSVVHLLLHLFQVVDLPYEGWFFKSDYTCAAQEFVIVPFISLHC